MAINIEKIIRNIVEKNYPSNPILKSENDWVKVPLDYEDGNFDITLVDDGSDREYFVWGFSQWSSEDVIAE
jgi:hypothetical protein